LARLGRCFAAVFPDLGPAEIPRASLTSVATWDSLASITLLSVLEEEFGVQIDPGEFAELVSFELILDYLRTEKHVS
jgi:acyl carrier protein